MRDYLTNQRENIRKLDLHIAGVNSPQNITVAGAEESNNLIISDLDAQGVSAHKLKTKMAYHSPSMRAIADDYEKHLSHLEMHTPGRSQQVQMVSSVTGEAIQVIEVLSQASYCVKNMFQPMRFLSTFTKLISTPQSARRLGRKNKTGVYNIVEIGPYSALRRPAEHIIRTTAPNRDFSYSSALPRHKSSHQNIRELAGSLWSLGSPVNLDKVNQSDPYLTADNSYMPNLPKYSFDQTRTYWVEWENRIRRFPRLELLGTPVKHRNDLEPTWRKFFNV